VKKFRLWFLGFDTYRVTLAMKVTCLLRIETTCSFDALVKFQHTKKCHNPENILQFMM